MPLFKDVGDSDALNDRLRDADSSDGRNDAGRHRRDMPPLSVAGTGAKNRADRTLDRLAAWTEAALALIDLELPQWQVRRIAYDEGEWYCALSRAREFPIGSISRSRPGMRICRWLS